MKQQEFLQFRHLRHATLLQSFATAPEPAGSELTNITSGQEIAKGIKTFWDNPKAKVGFASKQDGQLEIRTRGNFGQYASFSCDLSLSKNTELKENQFLSIGFRNFSSNLADVSDPIPEVCFPEVYFNVKNSSKISRHFSSVTYLGGLWTASFPLTEEQINLRHAWFDIIFAGEGLKRIMIQDPIIWVQDLIPI